MPALLESVVLVTYGFAIGLLGPPAVDWLARHSKRKRLGPVLESELQAIQASARHSIELNNPSIIDARKKYNEEPRAVNYIEIGDADFPTVVYQNVLGDIELFGSNLVILLTEVYRWIGYAHHHKQENLKQALDISSYLAPALARDLTTVELNFLRFKAGSTIHYAEVYLEVVERVASLAEMALKELENIHKVESKREVSVKLKEVHRETLP